MVLLPSLSAQLTDALTAPKQGFTGPDGQFDVREGYWSPPTVTAAVRAEAVIALAGYDRLMAPAALRTIVPWLVRLGIASAGALGQDEAQAKVQALASDLCAEYPEGVFTDETRRKVAKACKWFPSYAELAEILDRQAKALKTRHGRLRAVAEAPRSEPPRTAAVVSAAIRPMPGAAPDRPKREPAIEKPSAVVHPPSAEQLAEWAKAVGA